MIPRAKTPEALTQRDFHGRMAFVPEGQCDLSLARSGVELIRPEHFDRSVSEGHELSFDETISLGLTATSTVPGRGLFASPPGTLCLARAVLPGQNPRQIKGIVKIMVHTTPGPRRYIRVDLLKRMGVSNLFDPSSIDRNNFMPSFDTTVTEIREDSSGGCIVVLRPNELETTTDLKSVLIEPKFATNGGTIHSDRIELHCAEKPAIHKGQSLMVRALDPHGE